MTAIKLAFRNLIGAGLRTWLNVSVLSFAFVVIVFYNGMLDGWNRQARNDTRDWELGQGQFWHPNYDPFDPWCLVDAHAPVSGETATLVESGAVTPLLITQASLYPHGRMLNILLKGIDPNQTILKLPTGKLQPVNGTIPAIIGKRMAEQSRLKVGDPVLIRWRDKHGTFDAREVVITAIFQADVPTIDHGQVWIPLANLQQMTGMTGEATLLVAGEGAPTQNSGAWQYKDLKFLLKDFDELIQSKKGGARFIYGLLLAIALLAIFDTQVLAIFRRQKEIGTYIALGMTRSQVVKIFTIEGAAHSLLALILGALYGTPLLLWLQHHGIPMPKSSDEMGIAISEKIIPYYSLGMILSTILLVVISATVVSYFPTRKIMKIKPTDAIKGKIQ